MSSSTVQQRRRKPRVVYTKQEVHFLESEYFLCRNPDYHVRLRIAHDLGKDAEEIKTWFKNRRSKGTPVKLSSIVLPECNQDPQLMISNEQSDVPTLVPTDLKTISTDNELDFALSMVGIEKRMRKQRYTFTKQQIQGLEAEFTKCRTPDHTTKDEIAKKWKLTRSIVSNWFKNRRTKAKKEGGKENSAPTPPPPSTTLGPVISRDQPQLPPSPPLEFINQPSMSFQPIILYQPLMPIQPALMESLIPIELPMSPASSSSSYADFSHCLSEILNN